MRQIIPLEPLRNQTLTTSLKGQAVKIHVYEGDVNLFVDISLNDVYLLQGVIARDAVYLIRETYRGFLGDLFFFDTQGAEDPRYSGLGSRWVLIYEFN